MDYGVLLNYFSVNQRGELTDLHCSGEIAIDEYRAVEVYTADIFLNIFLSVFSRSWQSSPSSSLCCPPLPCL